MMKTRKHKKNYLKSIGAGEQSYVPCEICGREANHIHHIQFRSAGGSDEVENLLALCRNCHGRAHGIGHLTSFSMDYLLGIAKDRIERLNKERVEI